MDTTTIVLIILAIAIAGLLAAGVYYYFENKRRSEQLHERFGAEYERTVSEKGRADGEADLQQRAKRVEEFDIRELKEDERRQYTARWREVQADFADEPSRAILEADELVKEVMSARGYPMSDFERRAADLSVNHPQVVDNYRAARDIADAHRESPRDTEELRQAMIHYRALFSDLLGEVPAHQSSTR